MASTSNTDFKPETKHEERDDIVQGSIKIGEVWYKPSDLYTFTESLPSASSEFLVHQRRFRLKINSKVDEADDMDNSIAQIIEDIVRKAHSDESHVGLLLHHPDFANPIRIPMRPIDDLTGAMVLHEISNRFQSGGFNFRMTNQRMDLELTFASNGPSGSGNRAEMLIQNALSGKDQKTWSRALTKIPGDDLCLPKCVAVGIAFAEIELASDAERSRKRNYYKNLIKEDRPHELNRRAQEVLTNAGIDKRRNYNIEDIEKVQVVYPEYQFVCFVQKMRPIFTGPRIIGDVDGMWTICMLLQYGGASSGHFWHVKSINSFITGRYYCYHCHTACAMKSDHYNCPLKCRSCGNDGNLHDCQSDGDSANISCGQCNRSFDTRFCFENHRRRGPNGGKSWCQFSKVCASCKQVINRKSGRPHQCEHHYCFTCQADKLPDHICSITKIPAADDDCLEIRVAFDFETTLCRMKHPKKDQWYEYHVPCLIVALRSCRSCRNQVPTAITDNLTCNTCGTERTGPQRIKVFACFEADVETSDLTEKFMKWCEGHKNATFLAHNLKGFDGQFLLDVLESRQTPQKCPETILCGRKLMSLKIGSNRFVDTLNFLPMKLAAFAKAFELRELAKGHFPHYFNKSENFSSPPRPLPNPEYYGVDMMSPSDKVKFLEWHQRCRAEGVLFDFKKDIIEYCFSDVLLLSQGAHKFAGKFFELTNVRVFEEAVTIASAAMKVFRRNFVVDGRIAVTKPLTDGKAQSFLAAAYLEWYAHKHQVQVQHKFNGGEYQIPGTRYHADGFIHPTETTPGHVIEVNGCYYHLHSCKYNECSSVHSDSYATVKARNQRKGDAIRELYELDVIWECEIKKMLTVDREMREFFRTCRFQPPLNISDAFYGGRTEVFTLKMEKRDEQEQLGYFDFCSLYPTCNKYDAYPVGPPVDLDVRNLMIPIHHKEDLPVHGFINCKVLPPGDLRIPVLPYRGPGGLCFGLCRRCIEQVSSQKCEHSDEERALIGAWATAEISVALDKGYVIMEIYAAAHWEEWMQYDKRRPLDDPERHGPLSLYMDTFIKLKTEASGYPEWADTDERKSEYIRQFLEKEGIELEPSKIVKNGDARQVAKLLLNSLWGKMGQRIDLSTKKYLTKPSEFWRMLDDPEIEMTAVKCLSPFMIMVCYKNGAAAIKNVPPYRSVAYAALTTAYGRIRLYKALDMVPAVDLAYADTDSLIFRYRDGVNPVLTLIGDAVGELTDELPASFKMMTFVAQGPKCYSYLLENGTENAAVVKCRGFRQTSAASTIVNYDAIARHVEQLMQMHTQADPDEEDEDESRQTIEVYSVPYNIIQNDGHNRLFNNRQIKKFGAKFTKRRIQPDFSTFPFGYKLE